MCRRCPAAGLKMEVGDGSCDAGGNPGLDPGAVRAGWTGARAPLTPRCIPAAHPFFDLPEKSTLLRDFHVVFGTILLYHGHQLSQPRLDEFGPPWTERVAVLTDRKEDPWTTSVSRFPSCRTRPRRPVPSSESWTDPASLRMLPPSSASASSGSTGSCSRRHKGTCSSPTWRVPTSPPPSAGSPNPRTSSTSGSSGDWPRLPAWI